MNYMLVLPIGISSLTCAALIVNATVNWLNRRDAKRAQPSWSDHRRRKATTSRWPV